MILKRPCREAEHIIKEHQLEQEAQQRGKYGN